MEKVQLFSEFRKSKLIKENIDEDEHFVKRKPEPFNKIDQMSFEEGGSVNFKTFMYELKEKMPNLRHVIDNTVAVVREILMKPSYAQILEYYYFMRMAEDHMSSFSFETLKNVHDDPKLNEQFPVLVAEYEGLYVIKLPWKLRGMPNEDYGFIVYGE